LVNLERNSCFKMSGGDRVNTRSSTSNTNNMADSIATAATALVDIKSSKSDTHLDTSIQDGSTPIPEPSTDIPSPQMNNVNNETMGEKHGEDEGNKMDATSKSKHEPPKYAEHEVVSTEHGFTDLAFAKINHTLADLATALQEVKKTGSEIKASNEEIKSKFEKMRTNISEDLLDHKTAYETKLDTIKNSYDAKLDELEAKICENQEIKYFELVEQLSDHKIKVNTDLQHLQDHAERDGNLIKELEETVQIFAVRIQNL
jgi:hypothetical protein